MSIIPKHLQELLKQIDHERVDLESRTEPQDAVEWQQGVDPWGLDWQWLAPENNETATHQAKESPSRPSLDRFTGRRWAASLAAIAASLILGLLLGRSMLPQPNGIQVASASAEIESVIQRGPEAKDIRVQAPFKGFATVLALSPQQNAEVAPSWGDPDIEVPVNGLSTAVALPDGATRVLFVVTETPAGEPIRLWIEDDNIGPFYADELEALQDEVTKLLERKGYRRIAVGTSELNSTP